MDDLNELEEDNILGGNGNDEREARIDEGPPNNNINNNINNPEDEDDNDNPEDDDDDDAEDNDAMDVDDGDGEENDAIEGGVASGEAGNQLSSSCNMWVYIECTETLPYITDHPIYSPGIKVVIGLEKTTRLSAVFTRYCEFANNYNCSKNNEPGEKLQEKLHIEPSDLEFSHCSTLQPSDTAETSALMKTDTIKVRRARVKERRIMVDWSKLQRDSDKEYFLQLKNMMPDKMPLWMDNSVVFLCRGRIRDERGYRQNVLTSLVKGNERILAKRCKWLRDKIDAASKEIGREVNREVAEEDMVFEAHQRQMMEGRNDNGRNGNAVPVDDDVDDNVNNVNVNVEDGANIERFGQHANAVEDDEDDDARRMRMDDMGIHNIQDLSADESENNGASDNEHDDRSGKNPNAIPMDGRNDGQRSSPLNPLAGGGNSSKPVRIVLAHPPEAVKLLLEYCYTHRVIALGQKAFNKSYKPVDPNSVDPLLVDYCGPVSPFPNPRVRSPWADDALKKPTASLSVALAGIQLAEEANMPRLSLMCEIAASELVTDNSALEALALCEQQYRLTGNRLTHLRKSVMLYHVLGCGKKGVDKLSNMSSFKRMLQEKKDDVVPSLMMGIMEAVKSVRGEKDDPDQEYENRSGRKARTNMQCKQMDEEDSLERGKERLKRRNERWNKRPCYNDERNPYHLEDIEGGLILVEMERFIREDIAMLPKVTDRLGNHRFRKSSGSGRTSSKKRRR